MQLKTRLPNLQSIVLDFGSIRSWRCILFHGDAFYIDEYQYVGSVQYTYYIFFSCRFYSSIPLCFWEVWRFIRPALHKGEQKHARGVVFYTSFLFILGVLFGYYMVAPLSVQFLGNYQVSAQVANQINLNSFITTVTTVCLANGIIFQLPVVVYFLSKLGIVTPHFYALTVSMPWFWY